MTPMAGTPGWVEVTPATKFGATIPFILSLGDGQKSIYVWFKDVGGNVSTPCERHDSGQHVGVSLRVRMGTDRPRRIVAAWRRVHGPDLRALRGSTRLAVRGR